MHYDKRVRSAKARDVTDHFYEKGRAELRAGCRDSRGLYWGVGVFSVFVNLLMLTGPVYMLNIYDRVLNSGSVETLVALTLIVAFLYTMMGVLDFVRGRVMARAGARFQDRFDRRVFGAVLRADRPDAPASGLSDLEAVQRLIASPAVMAVFDLPWVPVFFVGIFLFHPLLGVLGLCGALVLVAGAVVQQRMTGQPLLAANAARVTADHVAQQVRQNSTMVQALGMQGATFERWQISRDAALRAGIHASDLAGSVMATTKAFRLFLQSAMLGLGAYLVLQGQVSPGAMIAASILLGRALAPVEGVLGQWPVMQRGRDGWRQLAGLLGRYPVLGKQITLPRPSAQISADQMTVIPPGGGQAVLRLISFDVHAGQAVGVIGPSGAGKTALAHALTGVWPPGAGQIRLGGAPLDHYDPEVLGRHIGYLPQHVPLFDGTIRDNIARMAAPPDDTAVIKAAQKAAAHDMILKLRDGYDTCVAAGLSGGQRQRIGLARALYGDPVLLVLDEPNASLDHDGVLALNAAIRAFKAAGGIVFIMAHRPAAIQDCDLLLVIENGARRAFGPRDKVLAEMVQNHGQIRQVAQQVSLA